MYEYISYVHAPPKYVLYMQVQSFYMYSNVQSVYLHEIHAVLYIYVYTIVQRFMFI